MHMFTNNTLCSSFCWGMLVFGERVKSLKGVLGALFLLNVGLVGMSMYASPQAKKHDYEELKPPDLQESSDEEDGISTPKSSRKSDSILATDVMIGGNEIDGGYSHRGLTITRRGKNATGASPSKNDLMAIRSRMEENPKSKDDRISFFRGRIWLTRRQLGKLNDVSCETNNSCAEELKFVLRHIGRCIWCSYQRHCGKLQIRPNALRNVSEIE